MEYKILTDPKVKPENDVLEKALGKNYGRYMEFAEKIGAQNLAVEWHYYNDGKSWLGKILYKKKNLCWFSVWNTGFKLTFYFTEETIEDVYALDINIDLKKVIKETKPIGKLIPIIIEIEYKNAMKDGLKILEYKLG